MNTVVKIPDIGIEDAEVTEILVKIEDKIKTEQALITVEGDKASMQIPSPISGILKKIMVKIGDKVSTNQEIMLFEKIDNNDNFIDKKMLKKSEKKLLDSKNEEFKEIYASDLGILNHAEIIRVSIYEKNNIKINSPILIIQDCKETRKILSPLSGMVKNIQIKAGDRINPDTLLYHIYVSKIFEKKPKNSLKTIIQCNHIYASPLIRRIALKYNINLSHVHGSGRKGRILPIDLERYINMYENNLLDQNKKNVQNFSENSQYAIYGKIEIQELTKIKQISGKNLSKNWTNIPHVTQFDQADIHELEIFRKNQNIILQRKNKIKITILSFVIKAIIATLKEYPQFNSSLSQDQKKIFLKKYFNIGIAVNTEQGLMVPIIFNADSKGILEISQEISNIAKKARLGTLSSKDMKGGCFTISNLGGIGGKEFTPIINAPEVAILGISQASMQAIWNGDIFVPRLMLPLSLSYDHRVIDGVEGAKFINFLKNLISDIRLLIL